MEKVWQWFICQIKQAKWDLDAQVSVHRRCSDDDQQHLRQLYQTNIEKNLKEIYAMWHWIITENNRIARIRHGWWQMDLRQLQRTTERHRRCHCMAQGHVGLASAFQADVPHHERAHVCQVPTLAAHSPNPSPFPWGQAVHTLSCEAVTKSTHPEWTKFGASQLETFAQSLYLTSMSFD